jgi:predicted DNA-binding protein
MTYAVASAPPKEPILALTVRLPISVHERLRVLAFETRRAKGDLIIEAIAMYLDATESVESAAATPD